MPCFACRPNTVRGSGVGHLLSSSFISLLMSDRKFAAHPKAEVDVGVLRPDHGPHAPHERRRQQEHLHLLVQDRGLLLQAAAVGRTKRGSFTSCEIKSTNSELLGWGRYFRKVSADTDPIRTDISTFLDIYRHTVLHFRKTSIADTFPHPWNTVWLYKWRSEGKCTCSAP